MIEQVDEKVVVIPPRFRLRPFDEIRVGSERVYLVKGIIPRTGLVIVWGPPKCAKSFWTFDLVMHVSLGWDYRGRRVQQGPVVYLALEGSEGFRARIEAFRMQHLAETPDPVPFYLITDVLDLIKEHSVLIGCIRSQAGGNLPAAVVIDTLNRSLAGSESDDKDMAAYIRAADAIRDAFNCVVIVVHHCGIDATRPRGHTSLAGAVDAQLAVKRDAADNILVTVERMKDGPEGDTLVSRLEVVEVGTNADGDTITSCTVVPMHDVTQLQAAGKKLTGAKRLALDILHTAIDEAGSVPPASNRIPPKHPDNFDRDMANLCLPVQHHRKRQGGQPTEGVCPGIPRPAIRRFNWSLERSCVDYLITRTGRTWAGQRHFCPGTTCPDRHGHTPKGCPYVCPAVRLRGNRLAILPRSLRPVEVEWWVGDLT